MSNVFDYSQLEEKENKTTKQKKVIYQHSSETQSFSLSSVSKEQVMASERVVSQSQRGVKLHSSHRCLQTRLAPSRALPLPRQALKLLSELPSVYPLWSVPSAGLSLSDRAERSDRPRLDSFKRKEAASECLSGPHPPLTGVPPAPGTSAAAPTPDQEASLPARATLSGAPTEQLEAGASGASEVQASPAALPTASAPAWAAQGAWVWASAAA